MAALIEAIAIKRKMFFEFESAPYHCLEVEVSRPTARGGQTLVRIKMRNLLTRAVFDRTFKAGEKFVEPDLTTVDASYLYADGTGFHFMDQETFDGLTLQPEMLGDDRQLLVDNLMVQVHKFNGNPIGVQFPPHVELTVTSTGARFDARLQFCWRAASSRDPEPLVQLHPRRGPRSWRRRCRRKSATSSSGSSSASFRSRKETSRSTTLCRTKRPSNP